jgi:hypothetical protein
MPHPRALVAAGFAAVLAIAAVPLLLVLVPPTADTVNHLARLHILAGIDASVDLQRLYTVRWQLTPYVGMDALGLVLAKLMPILWVGRALVVLTWALFLLGAVLLHRALYGRVSAWPLLAGLFLYSYPLHMGFLPYLLSAALAVIGFALWVAGEHGPVSRRVVVAAGVALVVYLTHYAGIVALGLCLAGYEAARWWHDRREIGRRLVVLGLPFVLPLALALAVSGDAHPGPTTYDPWRRHLSGLLSATMFPGSKFDMAILAFTAVAVAAGLAARRLAVAPGIWCAAGAMMLATLLLPGAPLGLWGMQFRLPVVAAVVLAAGLRPLRAGWPEAAAATLAGALFLGHVGTIAAAWRPVDAHYRELQAALAHLPRGSRVLAFRAEGPGDPAIPRGPLFTWIHMPALAVIERDAFYPNLHKQPMMTVHASALTAPISPHESPLVSDRHLWAGLAAAGLPRIDGIGRVAYWHDWPRQFDMAVGLHFGATPPLPPALRPVHRGSFFTLYRVAGPE